jgi:uncharacterized protein (TIGR02680 family)
MSVTYSAPETEQDVGVNETPAKHHPNRWRLNRAGIVNVWFYYDNEFDVSGGRLLLRGTNGSGKSRALEMLLPFLLDGDRRRMDATGSGKVQLTDLMKAGFDTGTNRVGYLWLELRRALDENDPVDAEQISEGETHAWLTLGAHVRYNRSTNKVVVHLFNTGLRVGIDLLLAAPNGDVLTRDRLTELVGADRITDSAAVHRDKVRSLVFGLTGESGAERYTGLLQLLHTLRAPDVGNRIDEGRLPQILSDALPPLSEQALAAAGEKLDSLAETRESQARIEASLVHVQAFLDGYQRYAAARIAESTGAVREAAKDVTDAVREAEGLTGAHAATSLQLADTKAEAEEVAAVLEELDATIEAIKLSDEYAAIAEVEGLRASVVTLAQSAERAFDVAGQARTNESERTEEANEAAQSVVDAVRKAAEESERVSHALIDAGVPAGARAHLPTSFHGAVTQGAGEQASVRERHDGDPARLTRPAAASLTVSPGDLGAATEAVRAVHDVCVGRAQQAERRVQEAVRVEGLYQASEDADRDASKAKDAHDEAETETSDRARVMDERVGAYRIGWRAWSDDPRTREAFTIPTKSSAGEDSAWGDAVDDPEQVDGELERLFARIEAADLYELVDQDLTDLDNAARQAAEPVLSAHRKRVFALEAEDEADRLTQDSLSEEAQDLRREVDPLPPVGQWQQAGGGVPFWRTVEFADELEGEQRAGLEGALLAAGVLTAEIRPDGTVRTQDGVTILTPHGPRAPRPLSRFLRPDPASDAGPAIVAAILDRISVPVPSGRPDDDRVEVADDEAVRLQVGLDGRWANGPLSGRHRRDLARHIGAAARAAARTERLETITALLAAISSNMERRAKERAGIEERSQTLERVVAAAPTTREISKARLRLEDAEGRAEAAGRKAAEAAAAAHVSRSQWSQAHQAHHLICVELGLPESSSALGEVRTSSFTASERCKQLAAEIGRVADGLAGHARRLELLAIARAGRGRAESQAHGAWQEWHREAARYAAIEERLGADAEHAARDLADATTQHRGCTNDLRRAKDQTEALTRQEAEERTRAEQADARTKDRTETLDKTAQRLLHRVHLPGLAAAAFTEDPGVVTLATAAPVEVIALVDRLDGLLRTRRDRSDENTLAAAQQRLDHDLLGTFDVITRIDDGIRLVSLKDEDATRSIAQAASELELQVERARAALTEHEIRVFHDFVLGGVAEELRKRIGQANNLVSAMRESLRGIRTSHNIGITLAWRVEDEADASVTRMRELVTVAGALRTSEQNAELTQLLRDRVEESYAADPTAGYTTHLLGVLDYRSWHRMEVTILGPEPNRRRPLSRKAKLSQGEIRFVSYLTLIAAVDAFLSGLPAPGRALRILLLDDAFAKVDEGAIGELMGLLVRLDVDFVLTAHGLWGTYRQVPALDIYEVLRAQDAAGPAVTAHTFWDGTNRHLRSA